MFTLYITQNKSLYFSTEEEAERFADKVESKTGSRPAIRKTRPQRNAKNNFVYYGKNTPHYAPEN